MPSGGAVYSQLKDCVSEITKIPRGEITLDDSLAGDYGYKDSTARRDFARRIESCFKKHGMPIPERLNRDKMGAAKQLKHVRAIVFAAFKVV